MMTTITIWLVVISGGGIDQSVPMQEMKASWYGAELQGHKMANGERFNRHNQTVAHRDLPLGTKVRLVNPKNGKAANAVVTDRGPYVRNRRLDVSEAIADKLGFKKAGTATLLVAIRN